MVSKQAIPGHFDPDYTGHTRSSMAANSDLHLLPIVPNDNFLVNSVKKVKCHIDNLHGVIIAVGRGYSRDNLSRC